MAICTFKGSSVAVPLTSLRPPPGIETERVNVACVVEGQVSRAAVTVRSVAASVVAGETARSSNVAWPLVRATLSRLSRHPGAARVAGVGGGGALAAGAGGEVPGPDAGGGDAAMRA